MRFQPKLLATAALIGTLGLVSFAPAQAQQVVNNGASTTTSTSDVTLKATVQSVVLVKVEEGNSTLSHTIAPSDMDAAANVPSTDFTVRGDVIVNNASANVQCALSATTLTLANGSDEITVNLSGTIGGTNVGTTAFTPTFTSKKAAIMIDGDLDESTATTADAPGDYTGTVTISASLL